MTSRTATLPRIERRPTAMVPAEGASLGATSFRLDGDDLYRECTDRDLMPWQLDALDAATTCSASRWVARNVVIVKPRQQGATEIALVRMLVGLFELDERQLYTGPQHAVARNAFERLLTMIERSELLSSSLTRVRRSRGEECIELRNGATALFRTRSGTGPRGISADLVVNDDAQDLPERTYLSLLPVPSGIDPQVWYIATPPAVAHSSARVLARMRNDAINGGVDGWQYYVEYSASDDRDDSGKLLVDTTLDDVAAAANPASEYLLRPGTFEHERRMMPADFYESQRLGIGRWPSLYAEDDR